MNGPSVIICMSVLLSFMPLLFIFLPKNINPSHRFKLVFLLLMLTWFFMGLIMIRFDSFNIWNWLAGVSLIIAVALFAFMLWSVLCWGYTISMLLCLSEHTSASDWQQWVQLYTNSRDGMRQLTLNRAKVLVMCGFARINENKIELTRVGHLFGEFFFKICKWFGVQQ